MDNNDVLVYVKASATLLGLRLDEARALRVAQHLARTAGLAGLLDAAGMVVEDELVEIYKPAPFEASSTGALQR